MDKIYCVFGDSVVQASYIKDGWPNLLKNFLEEKYKNDNVDFFNLGIGGNTTADVLQRMKNELVVRSATSIIHGIGVNDSSFLPKNKQVVNEKEYISNLESIIKISKQFSEDITFIGLVLGDDSLLQPFPGSSQGKSYKKEIVDKYDHLLEKTIKENNCKYIHMMDKLNAGDFLDGLHPNEQGHRKMFEEIKNYF